MTFQSWQKSGAKTKHSVAKVTVCASGHEHHSKREAKYCDYLTLLEKTGQIAGLRQQPFYPFWIDGECPVLGNGHKVGVTLDFSFVEAGKLVAVDVKGRSKQSDSRDWPLRRALFKHLYKDTELREVRK